MNKSRKKIIILGLCLLFVAVCAFALYTGGFMEQTDRDFRSELVEICTVWGCDMRIRSEKTEEPMSRFLAESRHISSRRERDRLRERILIEWELAHLSQSH